MLEKSNIPDLQDAFNIIRDMGEDLENDRINAFEVRGQLLVLALTLEQTRQLERIADALKELVGR